MMKFFVFSLALLAVFVDGAHNTDRDQRAVNLEGWALLGKYCFGYDKNGGEVGRIDLKVTRRGDTPQQLSNLTVLIFDSEASSWPSLTLDMSCKAKAAKAKDAFKVEEFRVNFVNGAWQMPHVPITEHYTPLEWYVVLSRCNDAEADRAIDVDYDLHWSGAGLYDNEMGPKQCVDNGATGSATKNALTVFAVILSLLVVALTFYVVKQRKTIMSGRGVRIDTDDDGGR
mmetsp:Transcript_31405/g.61204  ORF Transcript_31405/g.61204 Transcript_31405/m.61204 type:complete len:228 (+) Transcript_31405:43-726(+)